MWRTCLSVRDLVSPPKQLDRFLQYRMCEAFTKGRRVIPTSVTLALNKAHYTEGRMWLHILQASIINGNFLDYMTEFRGRNSSAPWQMHISKCHPGFQLKLTALDGQDRMLFPSSISEHTIVITVFGKTSNSSQDGRSS
jgi:hypothetical protein